MLERLYKAKGARWLAGFMPGRTPKAVASKARRLGLHRPSKASAWTPEQDDYLRRNFELSSSESLRRALRKSLGEIRARARLFGLRRRFPSHWTAKDLAAVFGVDPTTPREWVKRGWLHARKVDGAWRITTKAVRIFVYEHPLQLDRHKVNWISFIDLCMGREA